MKNKKKQRKITEHLLIVEKIAYKSKKWCFIYLKDKNETYQNKNQAVQSENWKLFNPIKKQCIILHEWFRASSDTGNTINFIST